MAPYRAHREIALEEEGVQSDSLLDNPQDCTGHQSKTKSTARLLVKVYFIVFFVNLGVQVLAPAQTQIYESIYCSDWYQRHPRSDLPGHGPIPEEFCKIAPVQTQISTLRGWLEFFNAAPGLLLSIPIGILTDKIGRRKLIILNLTVFCLTQFWTTFVTWFGGQIPLRAIWFGASLNLLSGGLIVVEMLSVCVLTDISPSDQVAETFFRVGAFSFFSKVVGPFLAGILMRFDAWWAVYCGLVFVVIPVLLAAMVPETLHWHKSEQEDPLDTADIRDTDMYQTPQSTTGLNVQHLLKIWSDWRLILVALTYPFRMICDALSDLLQRYISDRYGWTLADATLVYSLQAVAAGVFLFTILPILTTYIEHKFAFSIIQKNVVLARTALVVMAVAYAVIGLAPNAPVMIIGLLIQTLSTGFPGTLRAIATALIDESDRGRVFSVLAIAETLSTMMAYPVTATLFNIGIEKGGGAWLGMPYDLISLIAIVGFFTMCLARFERPVSI